MFTLTIENRNAEIVDEHSFEEGEFIVGRSQHCDVILASANVSRRHARLFVQGGQAYIEDLNSANGVYVGGVRIHGVAELGTSSQVRIGDYVLHLEGTPYGATANEPVYGKLTMLTPEGPGRVFWISRSSMLVGRGRDAAITIVDPSISRIHAKITVDGAGRVYLEDLQSANGTYCNGDRVQRMEIRPGDIVRLGNQDLRFDAADHDLRGAAVVSPELAIESYRSPAPRILLAALLLLVVAVGAALAMTFFPSEPTDGPPPPSGEARAATPTAPAAAAAAPPAPSPEDQTRRLRECIREARAAYRNDDLDAMEKAVECARGIDPADAAVVTLNNRLKLERRARELITEASKAAAEGRPGTALTVLKGIGPDSNVYAEAYQLRAKAQSAVEEMKGSFDRKCAKARTSPGEACEQMLAELLKVHPTDTALLKAQKRWQR